MDIKSSIPMDILSFIRNLTSGWSQMTLEWPLTPVMCYAQLSGSSYQIWWPLGIPEQFDPYLTQADPCMTFDLTIALHFGHGFSLLNLVAIEHSWVIWSLVDPGWPLWPSTPGIHYFSVKGSCHQMWWPWDISKAIWPLDDLWPLVRSSQKVDHKPRLEGPFPTSLSRFSSMRRNTAKRIVWHTAWLPAWLIDWQICFLFIYRSFCFVFNRKHGIIFLSYLTLNYRLSL